MISRIMMIILHPLLPRLIDITSVVDTNFRYNIIIINFIWDSKSLLVS